MLAIGSTCRPSRHTSHVPRPTRRGDLHVQHNAVASPANMATLGHPDRSRCRELASPDMFNFSVSVYAPVSSRATADLANRGAASLW
jgi:hypothetical protein